MTMAASATTMSDRPFVTARTASDLLGVPVEVVTDDVKRGYTHVDSLNGGPFGETVIVYAYELEGDRLAMHRARLAAP
jgi:hypothetical protein